jgi:translation initiation factor 3 subunit I
LTRYTRDGDILFSTAKDQVICAWFSANGERLGTYHGHQGAVWTVDVDPSTTLLASGAADNTARLWDVRTGKCIKVWDFNTAVKRVEFSEDGARLLVVTEQRMGFLGTIVVFDIKVDVDAEQTSERSLTITPEESKATVAGWSYLSKYIIAGHEDGSVSQYDAKVPRSRHHIGDLLTSNRAASCSITFRCTKTAWASPIFNGPLTVPISSPPPKIKLQR